MAKQEENTAQLIPTLPLKESDRDNLPIINLRQNDPNSNISLNTMPENMSSSAEA